MIKKLALSALLAAGSALSVAAQDAPSWMRYPAISPDGKTIVFTYKGDLYTVPATGGTAGAAHPARGPRLYAGLEPRRQIHRFRQRPLRQLRHLCDASNRRCGPAHHAPLGPRISRMSSATTIRRSTSALPVRMQPATASSRRPTSRSCTRCRFRRTRNAGTDHTGRRRKTEPRWQQNAVPGQERRREPVA